jgi:hypothetical protein
MGLRDYAELKIYYSRYLKYKKMTKQEAEEILKRTFKLSRFYEEQWETIEKILRGERVLLIEKTGFGNADVDDYYD